MTTKRFYSSLLLPVAALGLSAGTSKDTGGGQVTCEIRVSQTVEGTRLEPTAISKHKISGQYEFRVSSVASEGSSSSVQAGDFVTIPGIPATISEVTVDADGDLTARLKLQWPGGEASCDRAISPFGRL